MPAATKQSITAGQYAQALLELANEGGDAPAIGQELAELRQLVEASDTLAMFLRDPAISAAERRAMIERIFRDRVSPLLYNTLGVLISRRRLWLLPQIAEAYRQRLDEQLGNIQVQVTVASPLDAAGLENVRQRIGSAFRKNAVVEQKVDDDIIGGMVLRLGDRLIDASVRSQLEAMKHKLMSAAPTGKP
jgi:F-type H+-transporting ATPase subunit delta